MSGREPAVAPTTAPESADEARPETGLLGGVDEAGLGPILGPLVVAGVAMSGPRGADPWKLLERRVCRDRQQPGKVRVADSKKVHAGKHALKRLENTVLSFWGAHLGEVPHNLADWLEIAGIDLTGLKRCPWYGELDLPIPQVSDRGVIELSAHTLASCMAEGGIEILHLAMRPVDVEEFNASIRRTDNKSDTHFEAYSDVIGRLLEALPGRAHLVADRCGGRVHYSRALREKLPGHGVRMIRERPGLSTYELRRNDNETGNDGDHVVKITFAARGEDRSFPTALASCTAKYVREMMMVSLNNWFTERVPQLKRTAGYYVDGNRFLQDVAPLVDREDFPVGLLVRSR